MYYARMAELLGIEYDQFRDLWRKSWLARNTGQIDTVAALRAMCVELAITIDDDRLALAASPWIEFLRTALTPRDGTAEGVELLRARGYKIGLMSDSPPEVPRLFAQTALSHLFDTAVFSSEVGVVKPDPQLYARVAKLLGVAVAACVYVGNGDGQELSGALRCGMRAVLFAGAGERPGGEAATWQGPRITDLRELLTIDGADGASRT